MTRRFRTLSFSILLSLAACEDRSAAPAEPPISPDPPPPAALAAPPEKPAPAAHAAKPSTASFAAPTTSSAGIANVKFRGFAIDVPSTWNVETTTSPMRVAQFAWPKEPGDSEAPQMVVFYFEGAGGSVEMNLDRWRSQFDEPKQTPGKTETLTVGKAKFTLLDKSGTYKQAKAIMSPEFTPKPGWRMLAAIAEIDGGPFYFRTTGPAASMAKQHDAFIAALKSLRRAAP